MEMDVVVDEVFAQEAEEFARATGIGHESATREDTHQFHIGGQHEEGLAVAGRAGNARFPCSLAEGIVDGR